MNNQINIEQTIKNYILYEYKNYLDESKTTIVNSKIYNFNSLKDLVYKILDDLVEIKTNKQITIDNEDSISIPYGETLKNVFIEYLISKLNIKYKLNIQTDEQLNIVFDYFNFLSQKFNNIVELNIFNKNAIELENDKIFGDISKHYNKIDYYKYNTKINSLTNSNYEQIDINTYINNKMNYYENLVTKYSKGQKLTENEINDLQNAMNNSNTGYTITSFAIYVVFLALFLITMFIILIKM